MATAGPIAGFAHLEPLRHIPEITQLDGDEAATLGEILAHVTRALRLATNAELIYLNVFGERARLIVSVAEGLGHHQHRPNTR